MKDVKLPRYGAKQVWTFVKVRGHVLPVVAADDQYCVQFPDGTSVWMEKWDVDSAWDDIPYARDKEELKREALRRMADGHYNKASTPLEIDAAFERNEGKFED